MAQYTKGKVSHASILFKDGDKSIIEQMNWWGGAVSFYCHSGMNGGIGRVFEYGHTVALFKIRWK